MTKTPQHEKKNKKKNGRAIRVQILCCDYTLPRVFDRIRRRLMTHFKWQRLKARQQDSIPFWVDECGNRYSIRLLEEGSLPSVSRSPCIGSQWAVSETLTGLSSTISNTRKRLKTPLRSDMSDARLTSLSVIHVHKHKEIDWNEVISDRLLGKKTED